MKKMMGFTLVEMSLVLVIIGVILGAINISSTLQKSAQNNAIYTNFILAWAVAYSNYREQSGRVVGADDLTGLIATPICGDKLRDAMLDLKIQLPPGRSEGKETEYLYQNEEGAPTRIQVCFQTIDDWLLGSKSDGTNITSKLNVMSLKGIEADLAQQVDVLIDKRTDLKKGQFRQNPKNLDEYFYKLPQ